MNIYILGASGWIPKKYHTSSVLVEHNDNLFILDAGTGISNIYQYKSILYKYDTINLILSHYHLDHTIGLTYLPPFVRHKRLNIYGPGKMGYSQSNDAYIRALLRNEFFSLSIDEFSENVNCIDFPDINFYIEDTKITINEQNHSAPSFRISIDDKLIYATDTIFNPKEWKKVYADLLLHECWSYEKKHGNEHTSLYDLKEHLSPEKIKNIVLIHQNPVWEDNDIKMINEAIDGTNISMGYDGMMILNL